MLSRVEKMEVMMFSINSFTSYLSEIHLHTSMINCLSLVFISLASSFPKLSREGGMLYRILLGEGNVESNSDLGRVLRRVWGGVCKSVFS